MKVSDPSSNFTVIIIIGSTYYGLITLYPTTFTALISLSQMDAA